MKTIKIKQGSTEINYAKVSARVAEFLKGNIKATIKTDFEFKDGWAIFKATVYPDSQDQVRFFNGTSLGKIGALKAFEKLETIAVGRALAFAGYLSDGEIASNEEMAVYYDETLEVDVESAIKKVNEAKNLGDLQKIWISLSALERSSKEVESAKDVLKKEFAAFAESEKVEEQPEEQSHEDTSSRTAKRRVASAAKGEDNGN